jgi:hypothetical protein
VTIDKAEAKTEVYQLKNIETASMKNRFASAWLPEWKYPDRRGKREALPANDGERDEVVVIG